MRTRHVLAGAIAGALLAALVAWAIPASAGGPPRGNAPQRRSQASTHMGHVFVIMMENTAYADLLDPANTNTQFIQSIANNYGLETNYSGVTHVSLPNYLAATSGSNWGSNSDDVNQAPLLDHENIVDQFEQAHVSWKAYMENLPSPGDLLAQTSDGLYVRKHNPFLMYPDVYNNPARASNVVPLSQLTTDLNSNKVPDFVWITPNQCNNMHGGAPSVPVPRLADRRQPGPALPGWEQLPADLGHGDHGLEGLDRPLGDLRHLGRGQLRGRFSVRPERHERLL